MKTSKSNLVNTLLDSITPEEQAKTNAKMLLAAKIADAMTSRNWKNKDLLEAIGKNNPSIITKWLSGTHNFTVDTLVELEEVLDVKLLNLSEQKQETVSSYQISVPGQAIDGKQLNSVNDMIVAEPLNVLSYSLRKA